MNRLLIVILALILMTAGPVHATRVPPIDVSITPFVELPQIGQSLTVTFELIGGIAGTVTDVGFISDAPNPTEPDPDYYWDFSNHTAPDNLQLMPMQTETFDLTMVCNDPSESIRIEFKFEGHWIRRDFFLLPLGANDMSENLILQTIPGTDTQPVFRDQSLAIPDRPSHTADDTEVLIDAAPADGSQENVVIHLYGRIVYTREDAVQRGADGVTVKAYDLSIGTPDILLGDQVTDAQGNFDFYVTSWVSPDLYLKVITANAAGDVVYPFTTNARYEFLTPVNWQFGGNEKNFGSLSPTSAYLAPAFHIQTTLTRSWRFLWEAGYAPPEVSVRWPSGDNASYSPTFDIINMSTNRQWEEFVLGHEYGHHFNDEYGLDIDSTYCNPGGYSDDGDDCGHNMWCPENEAVTWTEGIADWFGVAVLRKIKDDFGTTISGRSLENLAGCGANNDEFGLFTDTEGILAAFVLDVADAENDVDDEGLPDGKDSLNLGNQAILDFVNEHEPVTAVGFVNHLLAEYPNHRQKIWETAANNRYNFDNTDPPVVAALHSTSHQSSGDSPDRTVDLWWNDVIDQDSGIDVYIIFVADNPSFDGPNVDSYPAQVGGTWTSPALLPGEYWFRIYSLDRAGNVSDGYSQLSSINIREADPPDLEPAHGTWPEPVLAKSFPGEPYDISPFLFGNIQNTYFSMSVGNGGELDAIGTQTHNFYVDGVLYYSYTTTDLPSYWQVSRPDVGPHNIRGGRHYLTFMADADEQLSEPDEDNNRYGHQYVWSGMGLSAIWRDRAKAPDPWGGFETHGIFSSPNCDGFGFSTQTGVFRGVMIKPGGIPGDYSDHDLRSFNISTGSHNGFNTSGIHALSTRPAGCLDAVFAVNDLTTGTLFNVGAYNFADNSWGFSVRMVESVNISGETETAINIADGDYLNLYRVNLVGGWPGGDFATVRLTSDPADGVMHAAVFDMDTAHAGLDDPLVSGQSDVNGEISLSFPQNTGRHGIAVWQDPKDVPDNKTTSAVDALLWVGRTPPDLMATTPAGWYVPVTPTDGAPGSPNSVPGPTQLQGNAASTYFNYAIRNNGPTTVAPFFRGVYLDGEEKVSSYLNQGMTGFTNLGTNYPTAYTVQGGRHTLSGFVDNAFEVEESSEMNNVYGKQWVWSAFQLPGPGGWITRHHPPIAEGGLDHVLATPINNPMGPPVFFNCDGLRTSLPGINGDDGWWQAVAILPLGGEDYDVRLHEMDTGVDLGFSSIREISTWAGAGADYVLVNFRNTQLRQFDVGVVGSVVTENYHIQVEESEFLGANPTGTFGPFTVASNGIMSLQEVHLQPGPLTIRALNHTGTVDWGMTLHRANLPYQSKTSELDGITTSWMMGGAGGNEEISVDIPESGHYCLAVWRADDGSSGAGRYTLEFDGISGVETEPLIPSRTALTGVYPNPFNPQTTIEFELAQSGEVRVQVFDVRGARIRDLVRHSYPVGRHETTWTGLDDRGQRVPSGTYFIQLLVGDVRETKRVSLVK